GPGGFPLACRARGSHPRVERLGATGTRGGGRQPREYLRATERLMIVLIDTNLLLRAQHHGHPHRLPAREAMARLIAAGNQLCIFAQIAVEFWVVGTRPASVNGFGWSAPQAAAALNGALRGLSVYPDPADLLARW